MTSPLHVLVYGPIDAGVCDSYRFGMYVEPLARLGVELRAFTRFEVAVGADAGESDEDALASESLVLDRSQIDWADVIVFKRFYATQWTCGECALVTPSRAVADRHAAAVGHPMNPPDRLIRPLFDALEAQPALLRGRAIVYETDDDLLHVESWNGARARVEPERDVVERMLRRADLVTVSTPVLATRLGTYNRAIRVVRNAVDPAWYDPAARDPDLPGDPRLLYYAKPNRMRDYAVCRPAVDELVRTHGAARRVWLGALESPGGGPPDEVLAAVDEALPYVRGVRPFAASLMAAGPDIGLAPLVGDGFDQAKSELHWLEYSMAGAVTVASRRAPGPFDVIRDGVDGFVAGTTKEWLAALVRLAESPALREEIAGRARERVLREYTADVRAAEWADAYRWAAEHAGRGARAPGAALRSSEVAAIREEAKRGLAYRAARRERSEVASARLATLRGERDVCWPQEAATGLVSVLVPVLDEPVALVRRALESVSAQTCPRVEAIVAAPEGRVGELTDAIGTARVVTVALPVDPADFAEDATAARGAATGALLGAALAAANGSWIAPLSPETVFTPDHVETLLSVAVENRLEFVYGQAEFVIDGHSLALGDWPPNPDGVLTCATELFAAPLSRVASFDPEAWREGETPGWAFWREAIAAGARFGSIDDSVSRCAPLDGEAREESPPAGQRAVA